MKIAFRRLDRRIVAIVICVILYIIFQFLRGAYLTTQAFKREASLNFTHFGLELTALQKTLDDTLKEKSSYGELKNKESIDWFILHSLDQSSYSIREIKGGRFNANIIWFYMDTSIQMEGIFKDNKIDYEENLYLESLSLFTNEVLEIYKEAIKSNTNKDKIDFFVASDLSNGQVYNIYESFFRSTDRLYMLDKYKYMRTYREYKPNNVSN